MDHAMPPYRRLLLMAILSFVAMYILMYMMVDELQHVFPNVNQFYMAGMMAAPMVLIELLLMGAMYPDKKKNAVIMTASAVAGLLFIVGIRTQMFVGDTQLIKSMIPHHAGAILMCEEAQLDDADLKALCESIIASQQAEIDLMRSKLQQQ
jgi:peptidoglycan/LPS O-acetylase OafA/YrhL